MITQAQLELLRRVAEQGQRTDNDVCVAASTLLALLDDLATAKRPARCPGCGMVHAPLDLGRCARCGSPLNNVSPGFSVVAGGARICTACLRPGEEIARARGL